MAENILSVWQYWLPNPYETDRRGIVNNNRMILSLDSGCVSWCYGVFEKPCGICTEEEFLQWAEEMNAKPVELEG